MKLSGSNISKMFVKKTFKRILIVLLSFLVFKIIYNHFSIAANQIKHVDTVFIQSEEEYRELNPIKEIVWWMFAKSDLNDLRNCGPYQCIIKGNTTNISKASAVLFYGSFIYGTLFPLPRPSNQIWAVFHEETLLNCPFFSNNLFLRHFNITSTFSRYSDVPLTTMHLPDLKELTHIKYYKSFEIKSKNPPVLFWHSNCDTLSRRELYVSELMQYIQVDSYGICLNNKNQTPSVEHDYLNNLYSDEQMNLMSEYKFVLSIENAVCEDYITEKFWRPLIAGAIPLYFGSPTIRDWTPNDKSVIYIEDFENAKVLAEFLHKLSNNYTEYLTYLNHKLYKEQPISNKRLLNELSTRLYKKPSDTFTEFECHVCKALHEDVQKCRQANIDHYNCPMPPQKVPLIYDDIVRLNNRNSFQTDVECNARLMDEILIKNQPISLNVYLNLTEKLCNIRFMNLFPIP